MAHSISDICIGSVGYSAGSHGGRELQIATEAPTLAFIVAYSLEIDYIAFLLYGFFTSLRVYCLPCIWLYGYLKLLFAAPLSWSIIGESLSLMYVIATLLRRRV